MDHAVRESQQRGVHVGRRTGSEGFTIVRMTGLHAVEAWSLLHASCSRRMTGRMFSVQRSWRYPQPAKDLSRLNHVVMQCEGTCKSMMTELGDNVTSTLHAAHVRDFGDVARGCPGTDAVAIARTWRRLPRPSPAPLPPLAQPKMMYESESDGLASMDVDSVNGDDDEEHGERRGRRGWSAKMPELSIAACRVVRSRAGGEAEAMAREERMEARRKEKGNTRKAKAQARQADLEGADRCSGKGGCTFRILTGREH